MRARIARITSLALLTLPALARATPTVTSDSECPSARAVTAALAGLLPAGGPDSAMAWIRTQDDHQVVVLSSEGEPVHSRELPSEADCEVRTQAAVLIIATWLDAMPAGIFESPEGTAPAIEPARNPTTAHPPTGTGRRPVWLGLGVQGITDAMGMNAGLSGEVGIDGVVGRLGLAMAMSAALARDVRVGQGTARWWRPALEVDLRWPVLTGDWNLEASLGPAIGLVILQGRGYDQNSNDRAKSWGAGAGLRTSWSWRPARLWIELRGRLWPETQKIRNQVQDSLVLRTQELPHWEGYLGLGCSLAVH